MAEHTVKWWYCHQCKADTEARLSAEIVNVSVFWKNVTVAVAAHCVVCGTQVWESEDMEVET